MSKKTEAEDLAWRLHWILVPGICISINRVDETVWESKVSRRGEHFHIGAGSLSAVVQAAYNEIVHRGWDDTVDC